MFEPQDFNYVLNLELDSEGAGFRGVIILQLIIFRGDSRLLEVWWCSG